MTGTGPALRYYHGGQRGLTRGTMILPSSKTGAKNTVADSAEAITGQAWDRDHVYVTPSYAAALMYAVMHPSGGWVHEVEPVGALEDDPDCYEPGLSFAVSEARIVRISIPSKWERKDVLRALGLK